MRGEVNVRSDGPSGRVTLNKGDATPGTPSGNTLGRQPPNYQRMHSNESGKGSDKDVNGNSGGGRDWLDGPASSAKHSRSVSECVKM